MLWPQLALSLGWLLVPTDWIMPLALEHYSFNCQELTWMYELGAFLKLQSWGADMVASGRQAHHVYMVCYYLG